jgi:hypothetical protein
MFTKISADSIETGLCTLSDFNASLETEASLSILTEQFQYVAGEREAVVRWLKQETIPEIVKSESWCICMNGWSVQAISPKNTSILLKAE